MHVPPETRRDISVCRRWRQDPDRIARGCGPSAAGDAKKSPPDRGGFASDWLLAADDLE
jgi:hypothetical protein